MSTTPAGGTQTVMFADVVDSTGLYQTYGDQTAQEVLQHCMDTMAEIAGACGGRVEKRIGDEVLCLFETPTQAVSAAGRMHTRIGGGCLRGDYPREMRLRVGLESGEVIRKDGELFGSTVHTAARLAALAKAGQILTTKETVDALEPAARLSQRPYGHVQLKGQTEERDIRELLWSLGATVLSAQLIPAAVTGRLQAVVLRYGEHTLRLDASAPKADIGRDEACALVVAGAAVSRLHARVVLEAGAARIEDMSSNGTRLEPEEGAPTDLHRSGSELSGRGVLRLGVHGPEDESALLTYECS